MGVFITRITAFSLLGCYCSLILLLLPLCDYSGGTVSSYSSDVVKDLAIINYPY